MARLFFLLSGEHDTLPVSELKAVLETEGWVFKTLERFDQTLTLEADSKCVEAVARRAAFTRFCGLELFTCEAETTAIATAVRSANFKEVLGNGESFAVRVRHVKNSASNIDGMILEGKIGELILNKRAEARVNLKNPDKTFIGILTDGKIVFGLRLAEIPPKPFVERRPRRKPFFHPSAMHAKLARCMVNLAEPRTGELVLDPFCGTGTTLIEAELIGCRALGLDIKRRMARGSLKNSTHFGTKPEGIIVADARDAPITRVDCVVTDPPYGRSATTLKRTTRQIVEETLARVNSMLGGGRKICIAAPRTLNVARIGTALGYKHLESHFVYVHRSLTREIAVFKKV